MKLTIIFAYAALCVIITACTSNDASEISDEKIPIELLSKKKIDLSSDNQQIYIGVIRIGTDTFFVARNSSGTSGIALVKK